MLAPALTKEEELHWLALRLIPGLGTRKAGKLVARFHTAQAIFRASRSELEASGLPGSIAQTIASGCTFEDAVDQQQKMLETGAVLVAINDPRYPAALKEISDPPIALFARGRTELLQAVMERLRAEWDTPAKQVFFAAVQPFLHKIRSSTSISP